MPHLTFTSDTAPRLIRTRDGIYRAVPIDDVVPPSKLMQLGDEAFYHSSRLQTPSKADRLRAAGLYLGAWALVHMLHDGTNPYAKRFESFGRNAQGTRVSEALARTFAGLDLARFDQDFRLYLAQHEWAVWDLPYRPDMSALHVTGRTMTDTEVHVLWARVFSARGVTKSQ